MDIAKLVLPSLFSAMSTPSTLSHSDRNFIEFTRCLHKLKSVVKELQVFERTVKPANAVDPDYFQQVNSYLLTSFQKLNHLCKVLLIVLTKLESNHPVRQERINSYRQELIVEWRSAIKVRQELVIFIGYRQFSVMSDEDSDTTIDPYTSSDSSDS